MEMSMKVIGLTGGIACGKSTASAYLKELGACIVDQNHYPSKNYRKTCRKHIV